LQSLVGIGSSSSMLRMRAQMKTWDRLAPGWRARLRPLSPVAAALRLSSIFFAAFGGAYGFMSASRSEQSGYDPHAFAIGASFLFAVACAALAAMSLRMRALKRELRTLRARCASLEAGDRAAANDQARGASAPATGT
jgi:hypothetical protein